MNREHYQKVIKARLREDRITFAPDCPASLPQRYEYLQDNAQWHKGNKTMEILGEFVDDRNIEHPAQSPDLDIMGDLWPYLDLKVRTAKIKSIEGLQRKLAQEWEKLPWSYIRNSVKSAGPTGGMRGECGRANPPLRLFC